MRPILIRAWGLHITHRPNGLTSAPCDEPRPVNEVDHEARINSCERMSPVETRRFAGRSLRRAAPDGNVIVVAPWFIPRGQTRRATRDAAAATRPEPPARIPRSP